MPSPQVRMVDWARRMRLPWVLWRRRLENPTRLISIELRQPLPFLLFLILLAWYIAAPSAVVLMCLTAVAGMLLVSVSWARAMALRVTARRQILSAAMQVGDEMEEQIFLDNSSFLSVLWAEFIDRSDMPGYTVSSIRAAGANSTLSWRASTICKRRGVFILGPWELLLGEPFGLFQARQSYLEPQQILVYPPLAALPPELLAHRGAQGDRRPLNQPQAAETNDSMSVRSYQPGDPLRRVHWPTTARRDEPFVKLFEPEAASRVWIVPDLDARAHCGEGLDSTEETTILLAASLAAQLLQDKLSVGLFAAGPSPLLLLPQRGSEHLWSVLRSLAPLHPTQQAALPTALEALTRLVSARDLLLLITPSLDTAWIHPLHQLVRRRAGTAAQVYLIDPRSFGGQGQVEAFLPLLTEAGLKSSLIRRGDLSPIQGIYGELSRWEFTTFGTGKAVARSSPRRAAALIFAGQQKSAEGKR